MHEMVKDGRFPNRCRAVACQNVLETVGAKGAQRNREHASHCCNPECHRVVHFPEANIECTLSHAKPTPTVTAGLALCAKGSWVEGVSLNLSRRGKRARPRPGLSSRRV